MQLRESRRHACSLQRSACAACNPVREACNPECAACNPTCPRVDIFVAKGDPRGCMVNENSLSSGSDTWPHRMYVARLHLPLATFTACCSRLATCYQVCCAALGGGARAWTVRGVRQREQHASASADGGGLATVGLNMNASMSMQIVVPMVSAAGGLQAEEQLASLLPCACFACLWRVAPCRVA